MAEAGTRCNKHSAAYKEFFIWFFGVWRVEHFCLTLSLLIFQFYILMKKVNLLTILFFFLISSFSVSAQTDNTPSDLSTTETEKLETAKKEIAFTNIDVTEFATKMQEENIIILDVRTPAETAKGKIEGAIEINLRAANFKDEIQKLDKSKTYLVYCRSGRRSVAACNLMNEEGIDELYNLLGGYKAWSNDK